MTAVKIARDARKSDFWFDELPDRLEAAVHSFDFENSPNFQPLQDLSAATRYSGIDVDPYSVVVKGKVWSAPGSVYVTLVYDPNNEPVEIEDSYPITVNFTVDADKEIEITEIEADVRSFYE
jgi:Predicted pPIWI-associating nuclease